MSRTVERWRSYLRGTAIAAVLGLATAYVVFHTLYPMATFPVEGDPSPLPLALILVVSAFLAGVASTDIAPVIVESFLAPILGFVIAIVLLLSPLAFGLVSLAPDQIPGFILHYAFVFFAAALLLDFVVGLIGLAVRNFILSKIPHAPPWAAQRK